MASHSKIVVTVTYGDRWHLLKVAITSAKDQGFDRVVIVDNASKVNIAKLATEEFGLFVDVISMKKNTGSAGGFKAGIQKAIEIGAEYILLLDDDNQIQAGCLNAFLENHQTCSMVTNVDRLAILAYRSDRQAAAAIKLPIRGMNGNKSAFLGFHILDIPFKIYSRTPWGKRWVAARSVQNRVVVPIAPYSGMFFHRSVIDTHGLPDDRFCLYADDTEFSYRITNAGGKIVLSTTAKLIDLELSWHLKAAFRSTFDAILLGDGDFRAFYSTRNNVYFEKTRIAGKSLTWTLNRCIYLLLLRSRALMTGRSARFALLLKAIEEGQAGRLGEHPDYPLQ